MIRYADQMTSEERANMRGGDGTVIMTPAFHAGDYQSEFRVFARMTIPVGASVGYHEHHKEEELYYFLSGTAEYNDNGEIHTVNAGDATVTRSGQGHAVRNIGNSSVEILAVISKVNDD